MIETILFLFIFFLSVIGLSEVIHAIWIALIKPKTRCDKILLCVLCGDFADLKLRAAYEEILWHGKSYANELVGVDLITDELVRERCLEFAECKNIKIVRKDELYGVIDGQQCGT